MKVRVLMMLTGEGQPIHYRMPSMKCLESWVPATSKPKRRGWPRIEWAWVEGKLVEDRNAELAVELLTTAGRLVYLFERRDVNMHGLVRNEERLLLQVCQVLRVQSNIKEKMDVIAERMQIHPNRIFRYLEKWEGRGWWECGVGTWHGWVTEKGQKVNL